MRRIFCIASSVILFVCASDSAFAKLGFDQEQCALAGREISSLEIESAYQNLSAEKRTQLQRRRFEKIYIALQYAKAGDLFKINRLNLSRYDVNEQVKIDDSATMLAWAARCGRLKMIKYLVKKGAVLDLRFDYVYPAGIFHKHSTAAIWAVAGENKRSIVLLQRFGANFELSEQMYPIGYIHRRTHFNAFNVPD